MNSMKELQVVYKNKSEEDKFSLLTLPLCNCSHLCLLPLRAERYG